MFFGSPKGLLAFFPERVIDDPSLPAVVLTDFWLFGNPWRVGKDPLKQPISFTRSVTLTPSQNIFSFEFSALSYSNPTQNRYRYRLEGLEKEWNERDSTRRLVTYTTLAPGDYVFRVQGSNSLARGVEHYWRQRPDQSLRPLVDLVVGSSGFHAVDPYCHDCTLPHPSAALGVSAQSAV